MKKSKLYTYWVLVIVSICNTGILFGQSATATIDRDKILIGEQINLLLKTDNIISINQWFNLPDTVNHLEVIQRGKIDTIQIAGNTVYQQSIAITSFDSGHWQLPSLTLTTAAASYKTPVIEIDVLPVDVSQMQDYNDIKDIVEVSRQSSYLIIIIVTLIALLALVALILLMRKKKTVAIKAPILKGNLSPVEWARQELEKLRSENYLSTNRVKQHYQQLTDITRKFFYLQLRHKSLQETTDEWMISLHALPVSQDTKTSFLQLLRLADTVKFAKYQPPATENEESIKVALQTVERVAAETDRLQLTNKKS